MSHRKHPSSGRTHPHTNCIFFDMDFSDIPPNVRQRVCAPYFKGTLDEKSWATATSELTKRLYRFLAPAGVQDVRVNPDRPFVVEIFVLPENESITRLRVATFVSQNLSRRHKR